MKIGERGKQRQVKDKVFCRRRRQKDRQKLKEGRGMKGVRSGEVKACAVCKMFSFESRGSFCIQPLHVSTCPRVLHRNPFNTLTKRPGHLYGINDIIIV